MILSLSSSKTGFYYNSPFITIQKNPNVFFGEGMPIATIVTGKV